MTQDKQLLLTDLCGRLPYGVIVNTPKDETDNIFEEWGRSVRLNGVLSEESNALKDTIKDLIELLEIDDHVERLTKSNKVLEECLNKLDEYGIKIAEILNEYKDKEENETFAV